MDYYFIAQISLYHNIYSLTSYSWVCCAYISYRPCSRQCKA